MAKAQVEENNAPNTFVPYRIELKIARFIYNKIYNKIRKERSTVFRGNKRGNFFWVILNTFIDQQDRALVWLSPSRQRKSKVCNKINLDEQ